MNSYFKLPKFTCAIFDLDGTLLDSTGVWDKIDIDFLGKRGLSVPDDYIKEIKHHNFQTGSIYTVNRFQLKESPEEVAREWTEMAKNEFHNHITLKKHAKEYLLSLKAQGIRLAVATSSDQALYGECLKRNGVYDLFDTFTETREVARGKGYPDVYLKAADRCMAKPEECVVYEDILLAIKGAKSGGFYTVGVNDRGTGSDLDTIKRESDLFIHDYSEIM